MRCTKATWWTTITRRSVNNMHEEKGSEYTSFQQAMAQLAALGITMAFAIVGGVVTGKIE